MRVTIARAGIARAWVAAAIGAAAVSCAAPPAEIAVSTSIRHQTFQGWEAAVLSTVLDYEPLLPGFDALLDQAAADLGITRLLISIPSGAERPPGASEQYLRREIDEATYVRNFAYRSVNDNADPFVVNPAGFDFLLLDWQMTHLVMPYARRLEARGLPLFLALSYIDFGPSPFEHHDSPDEYAEFMLATFDHLRETYGRVPDAINVVNEPDLSTWTGRAMGRVIAATADRLAAAGYRPGFIAPSTTDRHHAPEFFEALVSVRGVARRVTELSYHCYRDTGFFSRERIAALAIASGVNTTMNECWEAGNDQYALQKDLTLAMNSSWQQGPFNGGQGYYEIDRQSFAVTLRPRTKLLRQYYHFIRPGDVRVEAKSSDARLAPVAFQRPNGGVVVVAAAKRRGSFTVTGLPAGRYGVTYTTATEFDQARPDVTVSAGGVLTAEMPDAGVITIQAR